MLDDVLPLLRCPVCRLDLRRADRTVRCTAGHSYDVARQGHLNLLPGGARPGTADSAAMVSARAEFLARDHYAPLSGALARAVRRGPVIDVGAGTGEHLAAVLHAVDGPGLALDLSRDAARRAARAHPRAGAVVADAWGELPLRDGVAGAVLSVFAPRHPAEAARVLAPGGRLVVATPTPRHLAEVVAQLGLVAIDPRKDERLAAQLAAYDLEHERVVEAELDLTARDVALVVAMGPSAHHATGAVTGGVRTRLSVRVAAYVVRG